ncbi:MAG: serine/threonine-protein kinase [Proteobacteria bacterium]|nr:serine/threonine-protein kinase [Pseudomonadota bacterium]
MPGPANDDTMPASFPSYAELTQTQGWAKAPAQVARQADAELSGNSRYVEGAVLGIGGMGKVMLARDGRIGRDVAVKVLRSDRDLSHDDRERFLREAQVQGQLEHPSIVPVYDIDRAADGSAFFTMRRVLGRTLHVIIEELAAGSTRYTLRELLQAFATVCLTIDYAHSRGVVHRDLKPANLMLGDFGEVYVLDWGLARVLDGSTSVDLPVASRLSMAGSMMGTPLYMAPEQMADPDVGPRADVYALGAILFELLAYERLRDPRDVFSPVDARISVRVPSRHVAPELEEICVRATESEPADRFPTARALHDAVARFLEGDRELAQRRALSTTHGLRARQALERAASNPPTYDEERGTAMRELVRALALDPTNREHVVVLAEIIDSPPRAVPVEVQARLDAMGDELVRGGSGFVAMAMLSWLLFLPFILGAGILRPDYLAWIVVPAMLTAGLGWFASRRRVIGVRIQLVILGMMMLAMMAVSRLDPGSRGPRAAGDRAPGPSTSSHSSRWPVVRGDRDGAADGARARRRDRELLSIRGCGHHGRASADQPAGVVRARLPHRGERLDRRAADAVRRPATRRALEGAVARAGAKLAPRPARR